MSEEQPAEVSKSVQIKRLSRKKRAFLAAYALCGTITQACEAAGCSRSAHLKWMQRQDYREAFEHAHEEACDALEQEARRRAKDGWDEPVFHEGEVCGFKRKYSDTLMIFLMKGAMPQKYRDNIAIETHKGPLPIQEDANWYGNKAHDAQAALSAAGPSASDSDPDGPGEV